MRIHWKRGQSCHSSPALKCFPQIVAALRRHHQIKCFYLVLWWYVNRHWNKSFLVLRCYGSLQNVFKGSWRVSKDPLRGWGGRVETLLPLKRMVLLLPTSPLWGKREHDRILLRCAFICPEGVAISLCLCGMGGRTCRADLSLLPRHHGMVSLSSSRLSPWWYLYPLDVIEKEDDM